jgi:hypothetical protein
MFLFLAACDTSMGPSRKPVVEAALNEPFTLSAGQSARLADQDLSITFRGVLEDGRCPIDLECLVAGNATMSIRAEQQGKAAQLLSLALTGDLPGAVYEGFGIHAQQLMPERRSDRTIRPEDYRVRLLVDHP